jgi:hypothetical protein
MDLDLQQTWCVCVCVGVGVGFSHGCCAEMHELLPEVDVGEKKKKMFIILRHCQGH